MRRIPAPARSLAPALAFALGVALGLAAPAATADDAPKPSPTIRLATFNIHHGEGTDGVLDLDRVAATVRGADVVALQEVDVHFGPRSRSEDQAALLGRALGGTPVFAANLIQGEGKYGVALVSKLPVVASRNHPLPRAEGREKAEPRGLLEATLDAHGRRLRVYVTHLAHDSAADRRLQVDAIRRVVASGEGPAILMGDLNFRPDDPLYAALLAPTAEGGTPLLVDAWPLAGRGDGPTIGLGGPRPGRIDYILVTPDLAPGLRDARVDAETRASDHQPVTATLRLPEAP